MLFLRRDKVRVTYVSFEAERTHTIFTVNGDIVPKACFTSLREWFVAKHKHYAIVDDGVVLVYAATGVLLVKTENIAETFDSVCAELGAGPLISLTGPDLGFDTYKNSGVRGTCLLGYEQHAGLICQVTASHTTNLTTGRQSVLCSLTSTIN